MRSEQLRDVSISVEEKEKAAERRKTEVEQRSEGLTPETNPEKRKEEKFTAGFTGNIGEILESNQGYEKGSEESMTPETFSKILGEGTKRDEYALPDTVKDLDADKADEVEGREDGPNVETNEESKTAKAALTDNTKTWETIKTVNSFSTWIQEKGKDGETLEELKESDQMDKLKQEIVEEERESKLVAGISLHEETREDAHEDGEKMLTVNQENVEEKGGNEERESIKNASHNELVEREKEDHKVVSYLTPPLSTSSTQLGKEFETPATIQNPPSTPTEVPPTSSHLSTPHAKVSPQFFPPSVTRPNPTTIDHISVSTVVPDEVKSVLLLEDLLTEVLQSPGHHLKRNELEVKASPDLEDVMVKNIMFKPARKEIQTTREINTVVQPKEAEFIPKVQAATRKPTEAKFIPKDLKTKEPNPAPKSNENNPTAKPVRLTLKPNMTQPTGKPKTVKVMENDTKHTVRRTKASRPQPQLTKPAAKPQLTTAKTPSMRPTKINRSGKNKTIKKSKEKKRKKDNKTQKPSENKKVITPTHFPYFKDNYCPPECACYGR